MTFIPYYEYGLQYICPEKDAAILSVADKWYPKIGNNLFDAGFTNIVTACEFVDNLDEYTDVLSMLGYDLCNNRFYCSTPEYSSRITIGDDGVFKLSLSGSQDERYKISTDNFNRLVSKIFEILDELHIDIYNNIVITTPEAQEECLQIVINAAVSTRDLAKNLVRVKSSNIWSYGINIKNRKDKVGDVLVQYKDSHGGAGDIYIYYEVPVNVWRKWLAAPSKGHFMWQYIRNNYKYSKLTGDKKGKLANAIN